MKLAKTLRADQAGAGTMEFALAVPVLIAAIVGIFEFSMLLWANAGMQHALGEGARYATLYDSSTSNHVPTDANIKARMDGSVFGPGGATFTTTVSTPATSTCGNCRLLSISYTRNINLVFFSTPPITITQSKQVYVVS